MAGPAGPAGTGSDGVIAYTRWGRTTCPNGAHVVYRGYAAGSHYLHSGGAANTLCLTEDPTFTEFRFSNGNVLYGAEYQTSGSGLARAHGSDATCVVCMREPAKVVIMQPGSSVCPAGWNLEYSGYLMGEHYSHHRSETVCVDANPEAAVSPISNLGLLWYPTATACGWLPCPPYVHDRLLTCSVCSR